MYTPQNTLNLQIQHKRDTLANWTGENSGYVPLEGELIIVTDPKESDGTTYQDVKYVLVGDGHTSVKELIESRAIKLGAISDEAIKNMF